MGFEGLLHIKKALSNLNSNQVREMSERPVRVALHAGSQESFQRMENFFLRDLSPGRRLGSVLLLRRSPVLAGSQPVDIHVFDEGLIAPHGALVFRPDHPNQFVLKTLAAYPDLGVPLAKSFLPFRRPFVERAGSKIAREKMLFSLATALPDVIPNVVE